jgi:acyl-CoA reductase-like NAD-dependent aldehyde dehydrogenase
VTRVPTIDAAIEAANGTPYALGASVFSAADGERIAGRLRAGAIAINGALTFLAVPGLPFGGVGASGYGRVHGADGLREFSRTVAIARRRHSPLDPMTFRRGPRRVAVVASLLGRIRRRW